MKIENKIIKILGEEVFFEAMAEYYCTRDFVYIDFLQFLKEEKHRPLLAGFEWRKSFKGSNYWSNINYRLMGELYTRGVL